MGEYMNIKLPLSFEKNRKLLIIGNGFDLDLNLKTSYNDFISSNFFLDNVKGPINIDEFRKGRIHVSIFDYLYTIKTIKGWIDVESELALMASRGIPVSRKNNGEIVVRKPKASKVEVESFDLLRLSLTAYLRGLDYKYINTSSTALRLINKVKDDNEFDIVTFNYTNLNKLDNFVGHINNNISYIHGTLHTDSDIYKDDTSIILGFQDDIDIDDSFCFMIKSHSPFYRSCRLKFLLQNASEVIFFGHSLGATDYPYFADFFKELCEPKNRDFKKVRIFTRDEQSRQDILIQLRNMNNKQTQMLYEYSDFDIYRTSIDHEKINYFLNSNW